MISWHNWLRVTIKGSSLEFGILVILDSVVIVSRLLNCPPSQQLSPAVRALMEGSHAQWQVSGAYAANLLGLSEQVPARIVILTDGVPRRVSLGKLTLTFRRGAPGICSRPAGLVIQALRHLRAEGLEEAQLLELRSRLEPSARTELAQLSPKLAAWMRPLVKKLTLEEKACGAYCN